MNHVLLSLDSAFRYSSPLLTSMNCVSEMYFLTFQHSETLSIKMSNNLLGGEYVFLRGRTVFFHTTFLALIRTRDFFLIS
jgi:hypothetical protein